MSYPKRNLDHPSRRKFAEHTAKIAGVSVERLLEVIRLRKEFRLARMYRRRARRRMLDKNPKAKKVMKHKDRVYAGEGAMHTLMRMMDMEPKEFCEIADIAPSHFRSWYGHAMHGLPVRFLEVLYYARGMEEKLKELGYDTEKFKPVLPTALNPNGRYPRKPGDVDLSHIEKKEDWTPFKGRM